MDTVNPFPIDYHLCLPWQRRITISMLSILFKLFQIKNILLDSIGSSKFKYSNCSVVKYIKIVLRMSKCNFLLVVIIYLRKDLIFLLSKTIANNIY